MNIGTRRLLAVSVTLSTIQDHSFPVSRIGKLLDDTKTNAVGGWLWRNRSILLLTLESSEARVVLSSLRAMACKEIPWSGAIAPDGARTIEIPLRV